MINKGTFDQLPQESIASEFFEKLVKWSQNIKVSDPLEDGCRLGPIVSEGQVRTLFIIGNFLSHS